MHYIYNFLNYFFSKKIIINVENIFTDFSVNCDGIF